MIILDQYCSYSQVDISLCSLKATVNIIREKKQEDLLGKGNEEDEQDEKQKPLLNLLRSLDQTKKIPSIQDLNHIDLENSSNNLTKLVQYIFQEIIKERPESEELIQALKEFIFEQSQRYDRLVSFQKGYDRGLSFGEKTKNEISVQIKQQEEQINQLLDFIVKNNINSLILAKYLKINQFIESENGISQIEQNQFDPTNFAK
ncbi:hypothetical protein PPERSA_00759 [Pseudocohnilembus persalinus]|uniref:Uncharacterized protein n=1 Tax=Pseudocohnilembus persalinus TaxID=266149 RepID=A0A0V0R5L2_PSEPJ|nr:hypothetical protein PPERSA_00759 [Pseudocohnilembus persalinus]|eukprot:KRX09480.1 hypothetical protein PPERSA_00759 [Pseudocohnilembus persalinus]